MNSKYLTDLTLGLAFIVSPNLAATDLALGASAKDSLFKQQKFINCNDSVKGSSACAGLCTDMTLPYDEMKDINGRDANPKRGFAKPEYYDLQGLKQHKIRLSLSDPKSVTELNKLEAGRLFTWEDAVASDQSKPAPAGSLDTYEVGDPEGGKDCKWATIWVHGATPVVGGLGVTDNLFGGAFNRMKHLAVDNHGMYYSPSIQDFGDDAGLLALIGRIRNKTCPKGKILLNCGSAGTSSCWQLAKNPRAAKDISGMVLIGSTGGPEDYTRSDAKTAAKAFEGLEIAKARVPILFSQGEHDHPQYWRNLVSQIHKDDPTYPIRYSVFKDGGHMTPLRMLDWKATANCMLSQTPDSPDTSHTTSPAIDSNSSNSTK